MTKHRTRRPPHIYEPGICYLVTTNTAHDEPFFVDRANTPVVCADLDFYRRKFDFKLIAHVIMPNHIHFIMLPSEADFERFKQDQTAQGGKYAGAPEEYYLSKIMEDMKKHISHEVGSRLHRHPFHMWLPGFFDRPIFDRDGLRRAVDYVHDNPVKAKLVGESADYPFSSYRQLVLGQLDGLPLVMDTIDW
ncbi:MAG: hypothetical protein KKA73_25930 [Chloroflexi bacterium]|nr:hypothetical protein [Chloroflexota bacterium]MBU1751139.1 hypothetical protein [Chloroflexota bacterium]MBU1877899.1 hypothetical protein [Chloroflexota bacterium]